ncbi:hypothetical protein DFH09DRAFT_1096724 [Mycena vulgaris]|nr:hypothetical protein DFH09DRAFT_1096724 [Mycena vulgaris]
MRQKDGINSAYAVHLYTRAKLRYGRWDVESDGGRTGGAGNPSPDLFHVPSPFSPALTSHPRLHIHIRRARARGRPPQRLWRHGVIADGGGHERDESQKTAQGRDERGRTSTKTGGARCENWSALKRVQSARGGTAAGSGGVASGTVRAGPFAISSWMSRSAGWKVFNGAPTGQGFAGTGHTDGWGSAGAYKLRVHDETRIGSGQRHGFE